MTERVENYQRVVGEFNRMFVVMDSRTTEHLWPVDGIGSCGISKSISEAGLSGF